MTPPPIEVRQPLSHEWRRHSLVRVRRPVWAGHASTAAPAASAAAQAVGTTSQITSSQTTADDIAW